MSFKNIILSLLFSINIGVPHSAWAKAKNLKTIPMGSVTVIQAQGEWQLKNKESLEIHFTADQDIEARGLALRLSAQYPDQAHSLSLYESEAGKLGRHLADGGGTQVKKDEAWLQTWIDGVNLSQGKSYALRLDWDIFRGGTHSVPTGQNQAMALIPWVRLDGQGLRPKTWLTQEQGKRKLDGEPLWAVLGRGRRIMGQAWRESLTRPIQGLNNAEDQWQAQVLHFPCGYTPTRVRARIRRVGNPQASLKWMILKHDYKAHRTELQHSGELKLTQPKSKEWQWAEGDLPAGLSMPPDCHYVALASAAGSAQGNSCLDCYEVSGSRIAWGLDLVHELSWRGGAHKDRASSSRQGKHWIDDYEADLNIVLEGPPCQGPDLPETIPLLPTPNISWPWPR